MTYAAPGFQPDLTYDEYEAWHASAEKRMLEPARLAAVRLLTELLDAHVSEIDRARFRISNSRVKSPQRSFAKLSSDKYRSRFTTYDAVPDVVDDLVGIRLICNNLSDINTFQEIIGELPREDPTVTSLAIEPESHRDYFSEPKASGYRAFHVNFVVPVPHARGIRRLRVEVQVRTLLQDGWGELTHEDTYKPGSQVPEWIVRMSLRMAELLAAVDSIAQDLRTELDVETQRQVEKDDSVDEGSLGVPRAIPPTLSVEQEVVSLAPSIEVDVPLKAENSQLQNALLKEARLLVESLTRPTALAVLSQKLTTKFGREITQTWAQFGGFKKLLQAAVPDVSITGPNPGYVHPLNDAPPTDWEVDMLWQPGDLPTFLRALRTYDKAIPLISTARITQVITAVASTLTEPSFVRPESGRGSRLQIADIAKRARELTEARGHLVIRPHAAYVAQALSNFELLIPGITSDQIAQVLTVSLLASAERYALISDRDGARRELEAWLGIVPKGLPLT